MDEISVSFTIDQIGAIRSALSVRINHYRDSRAGGKAPSIEENDARAALAVIDEAAMLYCRGDD